MDDRKLKTCNICQVTKPYSEFYTSTVNAGGYRPNCKTCCNNRNKSYPKSAYKRQINLHRPRFLRDQERAIKRNIDWAITKEQHLQIWNSPCHYCGCKGIGVGIGRIDESIGFTLENSIPKCKYCMTNDAKRCSRCGDFKLFKEFHEHNNCRGGVVSTCKQCISEEQRILWMTSKEKRYNYYKDNAKKDGREFSLTLEEFCIFWGQPCYYCEKPIANIGLDRVNNTVGYVVSNIVSCCRNCNTVKNCFNIEQFKRITAGIIKGVEKFYHTNQLTNYGAIQLKAPRKGLCHGQGRNCWPTYG